MLKRHVLLLILFLNNYWLASQEKPSAFVNYTSLIEKGESHILESKYKLAMLSYSYALKSCKPLASDCFTAMQLASVNADDKMFKRFMTEGFKSGLKQEDIERDSLLNNYIKKKKLRKYIDRNYSKNRSNYTKSLNRYLLDTLNSLSKIDNQYKIMYLDSLSKVDTINSGMYKRKYDSIVSDLVENRLIPIIEMHGFPGERLIGVGHTGKISDPYNYSINNHKALFILLHYYINPKSCKYNPLFKNEVFKGNMRSEEFASIMDFQYKYGKELHCKAEPYNEWWKSDESSKFSDINQRRQIIGLGPFQKKTLKNKRGLDICYKYDNNIFEHIKLFYWCG